ncbi:hypothetical protein KX816_10585 [Sphingosinicellaceae bacterium]|nr:hypothetical protein KX816_10585 [Sphingosinicellaceae bacterium]
MLESEYLKLQDIVERNDDRALQIKGWSVTVSLAGAIAAIVSDKISDQQRGYALIACAAAAAGFWLIETYWKLFQRAFFGRINEIEDALRAGTADTVRSFQIGRSWQTSFQQYGVAMFLHVALTASVALPHVLILLISSLGAANYLLR